jgi:hypothetical protein
MKGIKKLIKDSRKAADKTVVSNHIYIGRPGGGVIAFC